MTHRDKREADARLEAEIERLLPSLEPPAAEPNLDRFVERVRTRLDARPAHDPWREVSGTWRSFVKGRGSVWELATVVVILGVIAAITTPRIIGRVDQARYEQSRVQLLILQDALIRFKVDQGRFPTTAEGLRALVEKPSTIHGWPEGGYLDKPALPSDAWGHPFHYRSPGPKGVAYHLQSLGADGRPGGEGEAADLEVFPNPEN